MRASDVWGMQVVARLFGRHKLRERPLQPRLDVHHALPMPILCGGETRIQWGSREVSVSIVIVM